MRRVVLDFRSLLQPGTERVLLTVVAKAWLPVKLTVPGANSRQ